MAVTVLTADDVVLYRRLRLDALRTDPDAFGSNYEREAGFTDHEWRTRITSFARRPGSIFLDSLPLDSALGASALGASALGASALGASALETSALEPVAIGGIGLTEDPRVAAVWGMWVAPKARGRGSARRILDAAVSWASERGVEEVILDVVRTNERALSLYEQYGFTIDDRNNPADRDDDDPCRNEHAMRFSLGRAER